MKRNKRRHSALKNSILGAVCVILLILIIFAGKQLISLSKVQSYAEAGRMDSITEAFKELAVTESPSGKDITITNPPTAEPSPTERPLLPVEFKTEYVHQTETGEILSHQNRISYGLRYPVSTDENETKAVKSFTESLLSKYLTSYRNEKNMDGVFTVDYEDGVTESLTSVIFHCSLTVNGKTETEDIMWVYNRKYGETIDPETLFADRAYLYLSETVAEQNGTAALPGTKETFSLFRFTEDGILFLYQEDEEKKSVCIPYIQLHTYMSVTINGLRVADMIRDLDPDKPMIALTFDDGPTGVDNRTLRVLKALEENNQRASFFLLGSVAEKTKQEVLTALAESGNELCSHTYSHSDRTLKNFSVAELTKEIEDTRQIIYERTGIYPTFIRPPYGSYNDMVKKYAYAPLIIWNVDSDDWKLRDRDAIYEHVLEEAKDGRIVLMHDIHEFTVEAAELLIPELVKRGFQLVTIRELFYYRGAELENGGVYHGAFN